MTYQRNETPEPLASGADSEALMPDPFWPAGFCGALPNGAYTADQMREAIRAATERAAKICDSLGGDIDMSRPDDVKMCANSLAAAIRGTE